MSSYGLLGSLIIQYRPTATLWERDNCKELLMMRYRNNISTNRIQTSNTLDTYTNVSVLEISEMHPATNSANVVFNRADQILSTALNKAYSITTV